MMRSIPSMRPVLMAGLLVGSLAAPAVPDGPARVRVWHVDPLVEGAPQAVQVSAASGVVKLSTAIEARARKAVAEERPPGY